MKARWKDLGKIISPGWFLVGFAYATGFLEPKWPPPDLFRIAEVFLVGCFVGLFWDAAPLIMDRLNPANLLVRSSPDN
jgi:hypothetical protein